MTDLDELMKPAVDAFKRAAQHAIDEAAREMRNVLRVTYKTAPEMLPEGCPAPRLQLRWQANDDCSHTCFYEFVFPLARHDVRRTDFNDSPCGVVELGRCTRPSPEENWVVGLGRIVPYRDSAHAGWDAAHFGNPPIYVISPVGAFALMEPR
jgi:hypothetical protein